MKLLVVTQAIDTEDPVLGFFHRWIEEFAKHCEQVEVICLKEGKHGLPKNVRVHSLGKPASRFRYIWNFYKYIFSLDYDTVFVHMNQEYVLLGGLWWRFFGKHIWFWRNHAKGNFLTRSAVRLSDRVFCTSTHSFTAQFKKTELMPVGIDTDFFCPDHSVLKNPRSILFLGRISPVKNVDMFIDALNELQKLGVEFTATIAGGALDKDKGYEKMIKEKITIYGLHDTVTFIGAVTQLGALKLYQEHDVYVNLTPAGSMDKTIFEAMACGSTPLIYNDNLRDVLGRDYLIEDLDAHSVARDITRVLSGTPQNFRDYVIENHSLTLLARKLFVS